MWWPIVLALLAISAGAWQAAGIIAVALITGLATYLVARRSSSGSISMSSADTLWGAAEAIRKEQGEEIVRLRGENSQLRERIAVLEDQRRDDRARIVALEDEVRGMHS